jgi:hypothetical protein
LDSEAEKEVIRILQSSFIFPFHRSAGFHKAFPYLDLLIVHYNSRRSADFNVLVAFYPDHQTTREKRLKLA